MRITSELVYKASSVLALAVSVLLLVLRLTSVINISYPLLIVFLFGSIALLCMAFRAGLA